MPSTTLPAGADDLCVAVLVLGDGATVASAARLAGIALDVAERAADALTRHGVLAPSRPLRLAAPGTRALLLGAIPPGARAIAHRRAVRALRADGAPPCAVARHACAVEPAGDPAVSAALVDAADAALASGAVRAATLLAARALAERASGDDRRSAAQTLATALTRLGDPAAPAAARLAASLATPAQSAAASHLLIDALWLTGTGASAPVLADVRSPGIAAARRACAGCGAAEDIAAEARCGLDGPTAFERCLAVATLIACDELDAAAAALAEHWRVAARAGAIAELTMLERLRSRLEAVRRSGGGSRGLLPGPDPGAAPWTRWTRDQARCFGTPSAIGAGRLARATDVDSAQGAVDVLRAAPRPSLLCQALLSLGRHQRHAGLRRRARDTLAEALALAERLGAGELAAGIRTEREIAGARPRREALEGPDALTASERRVAEVVRTGATNRQVADRLYLSPKTVEMHLGRVYRKLGIGSRRELGLALPAG